MCKKWTSWAGKSLKGENDKREAWCCALCKKEFKGSNRKKLARHYIRYVLGANIKYCSATYPPEMRYQTNNLPTKKQINKQLIIRRRIIDNDHYQEDVKSYTNNIFRRFSGLRWDTPSIGYNASVEWIWPPLIPVYSSSFSPIITTSLGYFKMNFFPYTRENGHFPWGI